MMDAHAGIARAEALDDVRVEPPPEAEPGEEPSAVMLVVALDEVARELALDDVRVEPPPDTEFETEVGRELSAVTLLVALDEVLDEALVVALPVTTYPLLPAKSYSNWFRM